MKLKRLLFLFLILVISFTVLAKKEEPKSLNQSMVDMAKEMQSLLPIVMSHNEKLNGKEIKKLDSKIEKIAVLFDGTYEHFKDFPASTKISFKVMNEHLKNIHKAIQSNNIRAAKSMTKMTASVCMHCHGQDNVGRTLFKGLTRKDFNNDLAFADYNFMTRSYDSALKGYDTYFRQKYRDHSQGNLIKTALQRIVAIAVIKKDDPKVANFKFTEYMKLKEMPEPLTKQLKRWKSGLDTWDHYRDFTGTLKFVDIQRFVAVYLDPIVAKNNATEEDKVVFMRLSRIISSYLRGPAKNTETPSLLYWLALAERGLSKAGPYSWSDLYLKECMITYFDSETAKLCQKEYEKSALFLP